MHQRDFDITIHPDGRVELHVQGYKGKGCLEAMKVFEEVIGSLQSLQHTSEFYEPEELVQYRMEQKH